MTIAKLTERLLEDRAVAKARPKYEPVSCHACGRGYTYRGPSGDDSGRFCSARCREAYDAGLPAFDPFCADKSNPHWSGEARIPRYSLPIRPRGFWIDCAGCKRRFDSIGLRCCCEACERAVCIKEDNTAAKSRACRGRRIPKGRGNRAKYCEDACAEANRRKSRYMASDSPSPLDGAIEAVFSE